MIYLLGYNEFQSDTYEFQTTFLAGWAPIKNGVIVKLRRFKCDLISMNKESQESHSYLAENRDKPFKRSALSWPQHPVHPS